MAKTYWFLRDSLTRAVSIDDFLKSRKRPRSAVIFAASPIEPVILTLEEAMKCADQHLAPLEAYLDHFEWSFGVRPIIQDQPSEAVSVVEGL